MKPIRDIVNDVHIKGDLYLSDCKNLKSLGKLKSVGRNLYLTGCSSLQSLPSGLVVGRYLYLNECSSLKELPLDMKVYFIIASYELKERYEDWYDFIC